LSEGWERFRISAQRRSSSCESITHQLAIYLRYSLFVDTNRTGPFPIRAVAKLQSEF
jgi:hypothetical protein